MELILKYTGIAGLSLTFLYLLFRNIFSQTKLAILDKTHSYRLLKLIVIFVFCLAVISLIVYFILKRDENVTSAKKSQNIPNKINRAETIENIKNSTIVVGDSNRVITTNK